MLFKLADNLWIFEVLAVNVPISRRELLRGAGCGFGYLALAGLAAAETANPLAPRVPPLPARAKRVIFLFMQGGVSQVDSFDYKPQLYAELTAR